MLLLFSHLSYGNEIMRLHRKITALTRFFATFKGVHINLLVLLLCVVSGEKIFLLKSTTELYI